jgi:hypothetical protein
MRPFIDRGTPFQIIAVTARPITAGSFIVSRLACPPRLANSEIRRHLLLLSAYLVAQGPTDAYIIIASLGIGELENWRCGNYLRFTIKHSIAMFYRTQPTLLHNVVRYFDRQKNSGHHCHPNGII